MQPADDCGTPDPGERPESGKRRSKPRSWLDTASPPPKEDAREPVASTSRRGGARRRSHGWTTKKRSRRRSPSPELQADFVEEEVEEYLRIKWSPGHDRVDLTIGD